MFDDKVVLVTGGTGSFGRRFCERIIAATNPRRLIVFSRDELKQHEMAQEVKHPAMRFFLGDVRDLDRLRRAMNGVDIVVHAAALKQVPSCEYNPFEAVRTNVLGAQNVIEACIDSGVSKAICVSTDKAVNPVNLYGATKLCAEKLFVQGNSYSGAHGARFSCARYGNVVGSRGSVLPLFLSQRDGGVLTGTDPRMTRFWITLDQGVDFVIQSIDRMRGGEIFVPKIPSMALPEMARAVAPDATVEYLGIRPGEKVHEVLVSENEARHAVELDDAYVILPLHPWWESNGAFADGKALPEGFRYTSETNERWLSEDDLRTMIGWT